MHTVNNAALNLANAVMDCKWELAILVLYFIFLQFAIRDRDLVRPASIALYIWGYVMSLTVSRGITEALAVPRTKPALHGIVASVLYVSWLSQQQGMGVYRLGYRGMALGVTVAF
ncbi:uncharacterized protein BCR38DRAFT_406591 [Pseudomassariella vexata]|uniref:Uncharacterized protein n=1 Tax=Pseudomassariella vexata TaxID=1141098 RepID=A0A1Y2EAT2_9PEZI|nr:uncharacterized protein BCR38DRAFT_406591 [Pseudomassariella vexata]ORY68680.1 hypothetical protein BCR38DRAFT_406591 [Pseudomassariella vexata]